MKDLKTTIPGIVAGVAMLAGAFGVPVPAEVINGVAAVAIFFIGLFSKQAG